MSLLSARDLWVAPPAEGAQRRAAPDAVIRGFSLELGAGDWVALRGANGSGKSTLLLALAGLWPLQSGELRFEDQPLGPGAPPQGRRHLAVILQDPSSQLLQPTVREELAFSASNLGFPPDEVDRRVTRWSERLGLAEELGRDPQQLSAGRQQLVLIGAAFVAQPTLLLADEPAAHLDGETRRRVLELVRDEVQRGLAVVWVTQDDEELAGADRCLSLGASELIAPARAPSRPPDSRATGQPFLTLRISPWGGGGGPAVRTSVALEITVARTGVTAIEGRNAVGKSVLLATAAGIMQLPQVQVDGDHGSLLPPILSSQYPELEIFEEQARDEVAYAAICRGMAPAMALGQATRYLERLGPGAEALLERHTWGLSGGEKRLLSLVAALITPASLYVLDEPTAGLDPFRCLALAGIVKELSGRTPLLIASQDRGWLDGLAARRHRIGGPERSPGGCRSEKTD